MKQPSTQHAAEHLTKLSRLRPQLGVVLGTGFASGLRGMQVEARARYDTIPGFTPVGVPGHEGELLIGTLAEVPVIVLAGRAHYYEGHSMSTVTFGVRALAAFGVRDLLLTNAAGGIHPALRAGDFMLLKDHINLMGVNPLRGLISPGASRFVDLTRVYDPVLSQLAKKAAKVGAVKLRSGVYLAVSGPSYETPAEIRAFRRWGADAVGMSTVPEAVVARQCALRVAAVSCITNRAAGRRRGQLSHQEVLETAARVREKAGALLFEFARLYGCEIQDSH